MPRPIGTLPAVPACANKPVHYRGSLLVPACNCPETCRPNAVLAVALTTDVRSYFSR